jgi:mediator of RNA polymerase II transcription subunit 13, fungi type
LIPAAWSSLASAPTQTAHFITVITCVDPKPPLSIFPNPSSASAAQPTGPSTQTPVGTPQPGVSPDPHSSLTPAGTPSASATDTVDVCADPDAHLVDIGDEVYGLVLGHRVNVFPSLTDYRPSLSSGYLLKTNGGGSTPLDLKEDEELKGPILVGVHLVWIGARGANANAAQQQQAQQQAQTQPLASPIDAATSAATQQQSTALSNTNQNQNQPPIPNNGTTLSKAQNDNILRDYLAYYRNLGTLARARGLSGTLRGVLPWHIVAVLRGVNGLEGVFGDLTEG